VDRVNSFNEAAKYDRKYRYAKLAPHDRFTSARGVPL